MRRKASRRALGDRRHEGPRPRLGPGRHRGAPGTLWGGKVSDVGELSDAELDALRAIAGQQFGNVATASSQGAVQSLIKKGLVRTMKDELRITGAGMVALGRTPPPPKRGNFR